MQRLAYACEVPLLLALLAVMIVGILLAVMLIPLALVQRYRAGTARRRARVWVATMNAVALTLSALMFVVSAALSNLWIPNALAATAAGLAGGAVLGVLGLLATRWEATPAGLHYTPNKWLVLAITSAVAGRLLYGLWRARAAWMASDGAGTWLVESGAAGALGAGALIVGYYLAYWIGVRRRVRAFPA